MKKRAWIYFLVLVVVLIVFSVLYVKLNKDNLTRFVSFFGSIASVFGIIITLVEVYHAERIAKTTKEAVKKKLDSLHRDEILSTIIKAIDECVSVLERLPKDDFPFIISRCRNLQDYLIVICGEQNNWINQKNRDQLKKHSLNIKLDIQTIERSLDGKFTLNKTPISKNFESLRTCLKEHEQIIKNAVQ